MRTAAWILSILCIAIASGPLACHREQRRQPPPDARRPMIKSEAELAAERAARIEAGRTVPADTPAIQPPGQPAKPPRRRPVPIRPNAGAIQADILMVNHQVVTADEVLYPLWDELAEVRRAQTADGFRARTRQLVRRETQRLVGSLLIYAEAMAAIDQAQRGQITDAVDRHIETLTVHDFGGSAARLTTHLTERSLTREQFHQQVELTLVVQQYTRDKLLPLIQVTRNDVLTYYREHIAEYSAPARRELLLIELPFDEFLPAGSAWERAAKPVRARAKLEAMRRARAAHAALAEQSFEEVAREHSVGLHAERGGSWGLIGRPLQAPYDQISGLIFEYEAGQHSEPIELPGGWYIVKCGRVEPATCRAFVEVQDEIREQLMESRFARLSTDYVLRLAENATISSLEQFINAAVRKAEAGTARDQTADPVPG